MLVVAVDRRPIDDYRCREPRRVNILPRGRGCGTDVPGSTLGRTRGCLAAELLATHAAMNPCTSLFTRSLRQTLRTRGICSVSRSLSLSTPPNPIVWKHPLVAPTRTFTTSLTAPARPPRIAQFLPNNVWKATHRSQTVSSSRSRNPYTPPPPKPRGPWRRFIEWLESIPSNAIVWAVLAINGAVFLSWRAASALYVRILDLPVPHASHQFILFFTAK